MGRGYVALVVVEDLEVTARKRLHPGPMPVVPHLWSKTLPAVQNPDLGTQHHSGVDARLHHKDDGADARTHAPPRMDKGKGKTRAEDEAMDVDVDGEVNVDVVVIVAMYACLITATAQEQLLT
ncbi:hypothetical protein B0H13DRAFT_2340214 [Mycena leptocephala]|nr:hypothetical protein B0H13DRAFT_2340214 [Mycena leptocephala]